YGLQYSIAYFYNVYGPGERADWAQGYGTVIEVFKQAALSGKKCPVNGPGTQTRAFTHVDDTVDALVLIGEKGANDEYSISAKEVFSLLEVERMSACKVEIWRQRKPSLSPGADDTEKLQALGGQKKQTFSGYVAAEKK